MQDSSMAFYLIFWDDLAQDIKSTLMIYKEKEKGITLVSIDYGACW